MEQSTQVTTKKENLPQANVHKSSGTDKSDLLIPRIMLQQPLSDFVAKGKCTPGDIVESINGEVLAKKNEGVEIIPITTFKTWIRYQMIDSKWQFLEQIPFTLENSSLQYEEKVDGVLRRNDACLNFFVLLSNRLDELPFLLAFKRSSYYAGRKLSTHFQVASMKNTDPQKAVFKLTSQLTTVDKNSFWTYDVVRARAAKEEEFGAAVSWFKTLDPQAVKTHDDETVPF